MGIQQRNSDDFELSPWSGAHVYGERSFVAHTETWSVREVLDPSTQTRVLIFASPGIARRVRSYPPNWRDLSSEALLALSWSR